MEQGLAGRVLLRLLAGQDDVHLEPERTSRCRRIPAEITRFGRNQSVCLVGNRVTNQVIQLAHLVPTNTEPGQVFSHDVDALAEQRRESRQFANRRRRNSQLRTRIPRQHLCNSRSYFCTMNSGNKAEPYAADSKKSLELISDAASASVNAESVGESPRYCSRPAFI